MRDMNCFFRNSLIVSLFLLMAGIGTIQGQGRMTIQATAMGTSTQLGRLYNINILMEQYSTPADQKALIDAFNKSGHEGLVDVLERMKSKGRIRFAMGGVGNDIKHIIELPSKSGRRFRLVTDRWLTFGELYNSTRSKDYSVGAIELTLTPDGKGSGTLMPACRLKMNKKTKQVEVEAFQFPWKLTHFIVSNN
jgi:hypothetical protein